MFKRSHVAFLFAVTAASIGLPAEAVQRAFVASFGTDANAATGCGFAAPCRSFAAAVPVVDSGGEVLALDSIGYGMVTIDKSITITAAPGAYAGISVSPGGIGVTIATAGVNVTLRGLNINNLGGNYGVLMTNGSRLSIENCVISNFSNSVSPGVWVNTAAKVRIADSLVRDNYIGVLLQGGATADIANSKVLGNAYVGIFLQATTAATVTTAAVSDSVASGNGYGVVTLSTHATGTARASVIRSMLSDNANDGARAQSNVGGTSLMTVSDSMATGNSFGLAQQGAGAVMESLGNNTVRQNSTANTLNNITPVDPI